jgi:hypothetical protein
MEWKMDKGKIVVPDPAEIEPEDIGAVMAQMAAIQLSLATRLVAGSTELVPEEGDNLLTVDEAAAGSNALPIGCIGERSDYLLQCGSVGICGSALAGSTRQFERASDVLEAHPKTPYHPR